MDLQEEVERPCEFGIPDIFNKISQFGNMEIVVYKLRNFDFDLKTPGKIGET